MKDCDYGHYQWFPVTGRIVKTCAKVTAEKAHQKSQQQLPNFSIPALSHQELATALDYGRCNREILCTLESARFYQLKLTPPLLKKRWYGQKARHARRVIGHAHMMTSSLLPQGIDFFEASIPIAKAPRALQVIKDQFQKHRICLPDLGLLMKFSYLKNSSQSDKEEISLRIEFPNLEREKDFSADLKALLLNL